MLMTKSLRTGALLASAAFGALGIAAQADASAFYLQEQSVKAVGRAFSGEVSEQGAQQMWWNPAAVGGISGVQTYFGLNAILPRADATNVNTQIRRSAIGPIPGLLPAIPATTLPVGGNQNKHNPVNNGFLPNFGIAAPITSHIAVGLTVTSPYSFTTDYGSASWARYDADRTKLRTYDIQPVISYSTGGFSIGAGPNIEYTKATLSNYLPDPLPPLSPATTFNDAHQSLQGDGWNVGWTAGFQYHNEKFDFGVSYKSKIRHKLKGSLSISGSNDPLIIASGIQQNVQGARATFDTPWQLNFGGRYHITPDLTLNGQITRTGWNKFDAITLSDLGPLTSPPIPENYHNTWAYAAGIEYAVTPEWTVRGGVQRDLSPIGTGNRDPRVPDGDRWNFALGTSRKFGHFTIDAAASYDKIKSNPIDRVNAAYAGTALQTVILTSGQLHNAKALVFGLGGRYDF